MTPVWLHSLVAAVVAAAGEELAAVVAVVA
jgi:hypothetical protein